MVAAVDGPVDLVAGIEARGFLFAAAIAVPLNAGVLLISKDGKLPGATIAEEYALEYGHDRIAMHAVACASGARVLLNDEIGRATCGERECQYVLLSGVDVNLKKKNIKT